MALCLIKVFSPPHYGSILGPIATVSEVIQA